MHPAYWPPADDPGILIKNLYHFSAPFYIRTEEPTDQVPFPPVTISRTNYLAWDREGKEAFSEGIPYRVHGDVNLVEGRLRIPILDYETGIQRREYSKRTKPGVKNWLLPSNLAGTYRWNVMFSAEKSDVSDNSTHVYFHRRADDDVTVIGPLVYDVMANPAGSTSWEYHSPIMKLVGFAQDGPVFTYSRAISTEHRTYACAVGGASVPDRARILAFEGRKEGVDGAEEDEVPAPMNLVGEDPVGVCVVNRPVGHLGDRHAVIQQAFIESTENPNPQTGYVSQNGYTRVTNQNGEFVYEAIPFNALANWNGSTAIRWLWSGRVYRIDIIETVAQDPDNPNGPPKVTVAATRTLIAKSINKWTPKRGTGKGVDGNGAQHMVWTYNSSTGLYTNTNVPIPPQYVPVNSGEGAVLCSLMRTSEDGDVEKTHPWNGNTQMTALNSQGQSFYIPSGMVEINKNLWFGVSRYTPNSGGAPRWIYSRDKGETWYLVDYGFTNLGTLFAGVTAVRKDLRVPTKAIYDFAMAQERPLAPGTA